MRIAYIAAGAAGMYCGSCLHDNTLAAALLALGEDVVLLPTYTPIRTDEVDVSERRIFFGGINVYLQQKSSIFRHTPWWFDRLFDSPGLLKRLTRSASSVDPTKLGGMTVSMLQGETGRQRKELEKLVHWLLSDYRPDVVHLSNAMQLGMARMLEQRCGPPVVCQLSGEDIFLEKLSPPYYDQARALLRERAAEVDAFVAINQYYADYMTEYLSIDPRRVHVIPHGLNLDGHSPRAWPNRANRRIIGYLARICPDKGLHLLIDACERLSRDPQLPPFVVRAAGYLGGGDRPYLRQIDERVANGPLSGRFDYAGELDRTGKIAFLQSLDVMSVPTVYRESKGLPALEAMANGVPVVLPDHGSFSELIADTGGGLLFRPHDPADLAEKLAQLIRDPALSAGLGDAGRRAVEDRYHAQRMAERTRELYLSLLPTERRLASLGTVGGVG